MKKSLASFAKWVASLLPRGAPEFIYTILLKPGPLRKLANAVLFSIIPSQLSISEGIVMLNTNDPVVSGALTLGVYEKLETELLRDLLRPGMTVIDIGANVGYYTLIACSHVGDAGRVIAFEPDPENFSFLEQTVSANSFTNVSLECLGISDQTGAAELFLSSDNKGDHRIYRFSPRQEAVTISLVTLDSYIKAHAVQSIDLIKMDIQGAEGKALQGMQETLKAQKTLTLITEFWPQGLKIAGSDPLWFLGLLRELGFSISEIREDTGQLQIVSDFSHLIGSLPGRKYTNLLCIKEQVKD